LFLATVAAEDLEYLYFNIKNTFTESYLKEKIYLIILKRIEVKKNYVLQILYSLYRLKQTTQDWNLLVKKKLLN
jgi:hypothetical protein